MHPAPPQPNPRWPFPSSASWGASGSQETRPRPSLRQLARYPPGTAVVPQLILSPGLGISLRRNYSETCPRRPLAASAFPEFPRNRTVVPLKCKASPQAGQEAHVLLPAWLHDLLAGDVNASVIA